MIHTFSVTIETGDTRYPDFASDDLAIADEIEGMLAYKAWKYGVLSAKVAPITGLHRQHLIGETEDV